MRKITKESLARLAEELAVISKEEQRFYIGGTTTAYSPLGSSVKEPQGYTLASLSDDLFSTKVGADDDIMRSSLISTPDVAGENNPNDIFVCAGGYSGGVLGNIDFGFYSGGIGSGFIESGRAGSMEIGSGYLGSEESGTEENSDNSKWDPDKAIAKLRKDAKDKSNGKCAGAVMNAIEAGGESTQRVKSAHMMNDGYLEKCGFEKVEKDEYKPQKGDVIVIEAVPGHADGHTAAMYDGEKWISDFKQKDAFGGSAYRKPGVNFNYYRHK